MTTINTVEPEPVYPFTIFAKSRPQIQEIAEKLGTTIIEQNDNFLFFLRAELRVSDRPAPSYSEREHILNMSAHGLKERLRSENISKEERIKIQEEIISIKDEMNAPRKKHEEETARLSELITLEQKAYSDWLTNDPEGIAATLALDKYTDYHKAIREAEEQQRKAEERRARRSSAIEEKREQLSNEAGSALLDRIKPTHPDIDWPTFRAFARWRPSEWDDNTSMNAVLYGEPSLGKSRALAYKAKQIIERNPFDDFAWITGSDFAELVSGLNQADERAESRRQLKRLGEVDWLFFDDLGSAHFTAARVSHFFAVMQERSKQAHRITLFTTNHTHSELHTMLGSATGKDTTKQERELMAERIVWRMVGTANDPKAKAFHFIKREI